MECHVEYTVREMGRHGCVPWYLPVEDSGPKMCDPWSAHFFRRKAGPV